MALTEYVKWGPDGMPIGRAMNPLASPAPDINPIVQRPGEMRYSPGGTVAQDYHWSGGMYSPQFMSYDKWGDSNPSQVYGYDVSKQEMPIYAEPPQSFQTPITNLELLQEIDEMSTASPSITTPISTTPIVVPSKRHKRERYNESQPPSMCQIVIVQSLLLVFLYIMHRQFGYLLEGMSHIIGLFICAIIILILALIAARKRLGIVDS